MGIAAGKVSHRTIGYASRKAACSHSQARDTDLWAWFEPLFSLKSSVFVSLETVYEPNHQVYRDTAENDAEKKNMDRLEMYQVSLIHVSIVHQYLLISCWLPVRKA